MSSSSTSSLSSAVPILSVPLTGSKILARPSSSPALPEFPHFTPLASAAASALFYTPAPALAPKSWTRSLSENISSVALSIARIVARFFRTITNKVMDTFGFSEEATAIKQRATATKTAIKNMEKILTAHEMTALKQHPNLLRLSNAFTNLHSNGILTDATKAAAFSATASPDGLADAFILLNQNDLLNDTAIRIVSRSKSWSYRDVAHGLILFKEKGLQIPSPLTEFLIAERNPLRFAELAVILNQAGIELIQEDGSLSQIVKDAQYFFLCYRSYFKPELEAMLQEGRLNETTFNQLVQDFKVREESGDLLY